MSAITTHILDTARGLPAQGVTVSLETKLGEGLWKTLGSGRTDSDGRLKTLLESDFVPVSGLYRVTFDTEEYFARTDQAVFYPEVQITFALTDTAMHYHIPLLLSPYGYGTYRGS